MTYRQEREELLKSAREAVEGKPVEATYDYFFHFLLLLKHAIVTRDVNIVPQIYFSEKYGENGAIEDKTIFVRVPKTLGGLEEFYKVYFSFVQSYFPQIEQDIEEAIKENKERYNAYKPPLVALPAPARPYTPLPKPKSENSDVKYPPINYSKIPPRATVESFRMRKDAEEEYNKPNKHMYDLYRLYLQKFLLKMSEKYPDLRTDKPYPRVDDNDYKTKRGRGDALNLHDGLILLMEKATDGGASVTAFCNSHMEYLCRHGFIKKEYHPSVYNIFVRESDIVDMLEDMSYESALPLQEYDNIFAIDGTGFSAKVKNDYYADKHHNGQKEIMWEYCQSIVGYKSGIIVCSRLYGKYGESEVKGCYPLAQKAIELGWDMDELLADKAYASKPLRDRLHELGVKHYYCEFPTNYKPPKPEDMSPWAVQYREYYNERETFNSHYHKRSKIESVFGAIKKMFGEKLSSHTYTGWKKEVYAKIISYNLKNLIHQAFLNGVLPDYVTAEEIMEVMQKRKD